MNHSFSKATTKNVIDTTQKIFTIDDICNVLSISKATAKNWVRLGKITPDINHQFFSDDTVSKIIEDILSNQNKQLKSRRNKKKVAGRYLYHQYVQNTHNQHLAEKLLKMNIIQNENDMMIILANFAIQLYYQSKNITYHENNVLLDFYSNQNNSDFYLLISDLLGGKKPHKSTINRLHAALSQKIQFVKGEDTLGFFYISFRDIGQRKCTGSYYTPEKVVNELIDCLYSNDTQFNQKTICDPCCGTGNFLIGIAARGMPFEQIYGQDIDPISVYIARINIALLFTDVKINDLYTHIIIENAYFKTFDRKFDVIFGNPPWGSDLTKEDKLKCRKIFKTARNGKLESYDLFIEKALSMLCQGGILAYLLPETILTIAAHHTIRKLLMQCCSFRFVHYLGNVFSGVQCPSVILVLSLDYCGEMIGCKVKTDSKNFVITQKRKFADTLNFYISDKENECLSAISEIQNAAYLKDNAQFAIGIVTGSNQKYISKEKKEGYETILKGSDIHRYTFKSPSSYIRFTPEAYQQTAPSEIYRAKEKLFYRFISEVPVFAYDDAQTLSLNSCNIVIPQLPGIQMKYILAILNSNAAAYFISKRFHTIKLLRSHIEQIPIPIVSADIQQNIIKKVNCVMNSAENRSKIYTELDEYIMDLYQLNTAQIQTIHTAFHKKNQFLLS